MCGSFNPKKLFDPKTVFKAAHDPLGIFDKGHDAFGIINPKDQGGGASDPTVVREAPGADAAVIEDKSKQEAVKSRIAAGRRRRALSLLATGSEGDQAGPATTRPAAVAGKQQLGA